MELLCTTSSPYARKILLQIHELNLGEIIKVTRCHPFEDQDKTALHNPLGKIPILLLEKETLFDSGIISEFIDSLVDPEKRLIPTEPLKRRECLKQICLADGIMDCAVELRIQALRFPEMNPDWWSVRKLEAINKTLIWFDGNPPLTIDMGALALVSALGYLEFRHPNLDWKTKTPSLNQWYQKLAKRESVRFTPYQD